MINCSLSPIRKSLHCLILAVEVLSGPLQSQRISLSAIRDWPSLIQRCFEHLKPGGWIEIPDVTIGTCSDSFDWRDDSSPLMRWYQCYRRGASALGIDGFANQKRTNCLATARFTHISEKYFTSYLNEDAVEEHKDKEIARLTRQSMLGLLDAVTKTMQERGQMEYAQDHECRTSAAQRGCQR